MSDPVTVSDEEAATALRHHHAKSNPPRLMAFPGYGAGNASGANGPSTTGEGAPAMGAPNSGGVAFDEA